MKNYLKTVCFIITSLFLLNSCGDVFVPKKRLEIAIWGNIKELKIIEETIKIYNKKYPDVKVTIAHAPQGQGYIDKLLTRAASGSMPDILFCEVNFVDQFIEKNMLLDVSDLIKNDKEIKEDDYFPQIINRFKKGKKLFGLPRDVAPFACIFYNKNLFDQEGLPYPKDNWDMKKFLDTAKKLTKRDGNELATQYGFYGWSWQNFVYCYGGRIVDNVENPKKCILNSKVAIEALTFYRDLIYKYKVMPAPHTLEMGFNEMFMTGKIAMYGSGIWETPVLRDIKSFDWDVVMFPKGPTGKRGYATGGSGYAISSTTKNKELAWELLKMMSGEYSQIKLAQSGLAQPALKKLAYGLYWAKDPNPPKNKGMLNEAVKYIVFNPFITRWSEIEQKSINQRIDLIIRDQIDIKKALNEIVKEVDVELKK